MLLSIGLDSEQALLRVNEAFCIVFLIRRKIKIYL